MEIKFDVRKSVDENAAFYFEKAKKAKKKLAGAEKALAITEKRLKETLSTKIAETESLQKSTVQREKKWFEKFRWFQSSEGFLCIGGRDATSNEIVIKKHAETGDVVFHTEISGSPFFVIKAEGRKPGELTLTEAAIAVASFSRAWRLGMPVAEVFYVSPEQLSKTPRPGEFISKGAFIVNGRTFKSLAELKLAIGLNSEKLVMCGPLSAVQKHCSKFVLILQGTEKSSAAAKKVRKLVGGEIDDIIRALPSGGVKIEKPA